MPLWLRVGRRWGKRAGLIAASAFFVLAAAGLAAGRADRTALVVVMVVLAGIGYAGMQMFPLSMLPDVIAVEEAASGRRRAGVFTGVWTAAETLGLAVGPGLLGLLLAASGYVSGGSEIPQPDSALTAVRLGFSVVPALLVVASLPVLARYRLEDPREP
jgi:Na+/melibiose symporter-like transporter